MTQILQGKNNDIIKGFDIIKTLLNIFELVRDNIDNKYSKWCQDTLALATTAQVSEGKPRTCFKMSVKENHPFEGLCITPNIMIYSVNQGDGVCWI